MPSSMRIESSASSPSRTLVLWREEAKRQLAYAAHDDREEAQVFIIWL